MIGVHGPDRKSVAMELTLYLTLGALISLIGLIALYLESGAAIFHDRAAHLFLLSGQSHIGDSSKQSLCVTTLLVLVFLVSLSFFGHPRAMPVRPPARPCCMRVC